MNITKNFTLEEFERTNSGVYNKCSDLQESNIIILCETVIQKVRDHYGKAITITSGSRNSKTNKAVGGAKYSTHLKGLACDFRFTDYSFSQYEVMKGVATWIDKNISFGHMILYPHMGFIHIDIRNNSKRVFRKYPDKSLVETSIKQL